MHQLFLVVLAFLNCSLTYSQVQRTAVSRTDLKNIVVVQFLHPPQVTELKNILMLQSCTVHPAQKVCSTYFLIHQVDTQKLISSHCLTVPSALE